MTSRGLIDSTSITARPCARRAVSRPHARVFSHPLLWYFTSSTIPSRT